MQTAGKTIFMMYEGRRVRLCNQRCRDWTARYDYQGTGWKSTLMRWPIFP